MGPTIESSYSSSPDSTTLVTTSAEAMSKLTTVRFRWLATYDVGIVPEEVLSAVGEFVAPDRLRFSLRSTRANPGLIAALGDEVIVIGSQMWRQTGQQPWTALNPRFYPAPVNPDGVIAIRPEIAPYMLNANVTDDGDSYVISSNWDIAGSGAIYGFTYGPFLAGFPLFYVGPDPQPAWDKVSDHLTLRIDKASMLLQSIETVTTVPVTASEHGPTRIDTFRVGLAYSGFNDPSIVVTAPTHDQ